MKYRIHKLKTHIGPFCAVLSGDKTAEFRRYDDRDFRVGDILVLEEIEMRLDAEEVEYAHYTGRAEFRRISHILQGEYGVPAGYAMLSLHELSGEEMMEVIRQLTDNFSHTFRPGQVV